MTRFLAISVLSFVLIVGLTIILHISTDIKFHPILIAPALGISIIIGHLLARTRSVIRIEGDHITINEERFPIKNVIGYFVNDNGISQTALSLRLDTRRSIHITGVNFGKDGKRFQEIQQQIVHQLKAAKPDLRKLTYQDVHVGQMTYLHPLIFMLIGEVIIVDIYILYLYAKGTPHIPWQALFVNVIAICLLPYLKKRKDPMI